MLLMHLYKTAFSTQKLNVIIDNCELYKILRSQVVKNIVEVVCKSNKYRADRAK